MHSSGIIPIYDVGLNLFFHIKTLYLFTRSDFKTIVAPISFFAFAAAPSVSLLRLPHVIFWLWLHLLQLCVSNQALSPREDEINKPWRPIPSRRITPRAARVLSWGLLPACILLSNWYDALGMSIVFIILAWVYNEGRMHSALLAKQFCNALGYASLEMGATVIAARNVPLDGIALAAVVMSSLVILTTGWAQDFPDQDGDRLQGNMTIPLAAPNAARMSLPAVLLAWSISLSAFWKVGLNIYIPFIAFSGILGFRIWHFRDTKADQLSFLLYNVWLMTVHFLPAMTPTRWAADMHAQHGYV